MANTQGLIYQTHHPDSTKVVDIDCHIVRFLQPNLDLGGRIEWV